MPAVRGILWRSLPVGSLLVGYCEFIIPPPQAGPSARLLTVAFTVLRTKKHQRERLGKSSLFSKIVQFANTHSHDTIGTFAHITV